MISKQTKSTIESVNNLNLNGSEKTKCCRVVICVSIRRKERL